MKFIIYWDAGYGIDHGLVEAKDYDEAVDLAYENWKQNADYGVEVENPTDEQIDEYL